MRGSGRADAQRKAKRRWGVGSAESPSSLADSVASRAPTVSPAAALQSYLTFQLLHAYGSELGQAFVTEDFALEHLLEGTETVAMKSAGSSMPSIFVRGVGATITIR